MPFGPWQAAQASSFVRISAGTSAANAAAVAQASSAATPASVRDSSPRPGSSRAGIASFMSLAVADLIDRPGLVVGDEHRAVRRHDDVGWPAEDLLSVEPGAGEDLLLGVLAVRIDDHAHDPVAALLL